MQYFLVTLAAAVCLLANGDAEASTATGSFNVQVTIAATCVVTSATTLDFGAQGVLAANIDQTSAINVTCTNTTPYNIGLDKGLNGSSVTTRQPAGDYLLDTDEELIEGLSRLAYRRVATLLHLPSTSRPQGRTEVLSVSPAELDAALEKDRIGGA